MTAASDIEGEQLQVTPTETSINQIGIQTDGTFTVERGPRSPLGAQNQNQSSAQNRMWA